MSPTPTIQSGNISRISKWLLGAIGAGTLFSVIASLLFWGFPSLCVNWAEVTGLEAALFYQVISQEGRLYTAPGASIVLYDKPMKNFQEIEIGDILLVTSTKHRWAMIEDAKEKYGFRRADKPPQTDAGACYIVTGKYYAIDDNDLKLFKETPTTSAGYVKAREIGCRCSKLFWNPFGNMVQ